MNDTPVTEYDSDDPSNEASVEDAIERLRAVDPADAADLAEDIAQTLGAELDPPQAVEASDPGP